MVITFQIFPGLFPRQTSPTPNPSSISSLFISCHIHNIFPIHIYFPALFIDRIPIFLPSFILLDILYQSSTISKSLLLIKTTSAKQTSPFSAFLLHSSPEIVPEKSPRRHSPPKARSSIKKLSLLVSPTLPQSHASTSCSTQQRSYSHYISSSSFLSIPASASRVFNYLSVSAPSYTVPHQFVSRANFPLLNPFPPSILSDACPP
ncbi:hypothetical protein HYPSUDRAFT_960876 [Hypholoma sublateritium FD-334 SS-4]|uniref:Uncharacterized protein n=1 Tax=Hypholoma sublateritium (strain FD-334 SS-4) TaxID=945553 RepID=A0A0D2M573_HYPSF|nr:hypothetical protein HYPSUDRAFT_960876 [Hypholoma sublateritium FD-334 SS-4]